MARSVEWSPEKHLASEGMPIAILKNGIFQPALSGAGKVVAEGRSNLKLCLNWL